MHCKYENDGPTEGPPSRVSGLLLVSVEECNDENPAVVSHLSSCQHGCFTGSARFTQCWINPVGCEDLGHEHI